MNRSKVFSLQVKQKMLNEWTVLLSCLICKSVNCVCFLALQNQSLVYNDTSGIIMSNQSLVLRGLTRNHSGNYKCIGVNSHGTGVSNSVRLTVRFAPLCQESIRNIRGRGRSQFLTLSCPVQSLSHPFKFRWALTNSFLISHSSFLLQCAK